MLDQVLVDGEGVGIASLLIASGMPARTGDSASGRAKNLAAGASRRSGVELEKAAKDEVRHESGHQ